MYSWNILIIKTLRKRPHEDIVVPKYLVRQPLEVGFTETIGKPQGQIKDYELTLSDGKRIHIREFKDHYRVHWDIMSPRIDPIEHLRQDAPHWWVLLVGIVGAALGYLALRKVENAINGMLLGMLVSVLTIEN